MNKNIITVAYLVLQTIAISASTSPHHKNNDKNIRQESDLMHCVCQSKSEKIYLPNCAYYNPWSLVNYFKSIKLTDKQIQEALDRDYTIEQVQAKYLNKKTRSL